MAKHKYAFGDWGTLANEWRRALEADNRSPSTVRIYLHSVRMLGDWAMAQDPPLEPVDMTAGSIRDFIKHRIDSTSAGNAHNTTAPSAPSSSGSSRRTNSTTPRCGARPRRCCPRSWSRW